MSESNFTKQIIQPKQSERRAWLCGFGWHKWGKWTIGKCTVASILYKGLIDGTYQSRECNRCGKTQIEII